MNDKIYKALSKRNFKNYSIEQVTETVITIYDNEGTGKSITLDFDNLIMSVDDAPYGTFKYLLKIAAIVVNTVGRGDFDAYDWTIQLKK